MFFYLQFTASSVWRTPYGPVGLTAVRRSLDRVVGRLDRVLLGNG